MAQPCALNAIKSYNTLNLVFVSQTTHGKMDFETYLLRLIILYSYSAVYLELTYGKIKILWLQKTVSRPATLSSQIRHSSLLIDDSDIPFFQYKYI